MIKKKLLYLLIVLLLFLISCTTTQTKIIKVDKKTTGYILKDDKLALAPPIVNSNYSYEIHDLMNKIGKAILSNSFRMTPEIKINDYNNKKIVILKTSRAVAADFVVYGKVEHSKITFYPERNKFPDHVNLENVDENQIQYGERLNISIDLELYNSKNYFKVIERSYNYSFFTMPFEEDKKEENWIDSKIKISIREGLKKFLKEIGGEEIKTPRMIFSH